MSERRYRRIWQWMACAFAAGYVFGVSLPHGPGITSDSIHYMTAAHSLLNGGTLSTYTGAPLVSYAPLLSAIYAVWLSIGVGAHVGAVITSAVSFAVVVWIAAVWLYSVVGDSRRVWVLAVMAVLLTRPLLWYAPYALSELPFMALVMLTLWNTWQYTERGQYRYFWGAGLSGALCPLMRYIGVCAVLAAGLSLLAKSERPFGRRLNLSAGFVGLTLMPVALWAVRNRLVSGTFFGVRQPSDYSLRQMVFETLWSWHRWVTPTAFENSTALFGLAIAVLVVLGGVGLSRTWRLQSGGLQNAFVLLILYVTLYGGVFTVTASGVKFEGFSERLWLPISVPVVLMAAVAFRIVRDEQHWVPKAFRVMLALLAVGWIASGAWMAGETIHKSVHHQLGVFTTAEWRHSDIIGYLREHKLEGRVFSNYPEPLYYLTGIVAEQTPHHGPMRVASETYPRNMQEFLEVVHGVKDRPVWIVWFNNPSRSHFMWSIHDIGKQIPIALYQGFEDGSIWQVAVSATKSTRSSGVGRE